MNCYVVTKNHDGWSETELVKTKEEAQERIAAYNRENEETACKYAMFYERDLVDVLYEALDGQNIQLDRNWLIDNLKNVLGD